MKNNIEENNKEKKLQQTPPNETILTDDEKATKKKCPRRLSSKALIGIIVTVIALVVVTTIVLVSIFVIVPEQYRKTGGLKSGDSIVETTDPEMIISQKVNEETWNNIVNVFNGSESADSIISLSNTSATATRSLACKQNVTLDGEPYLGSLSQIEGKKVKTEDLLNNTVVYSYSDTDSRGKDIYYIYQDVNNRWIKTQISDSFVKRMNQKIQETTKKIDWNFNNFKYNNKTNAYEGKMTISGATFDVTLKIVNNLPCYMRLFTVAENTKLELVTFFFNINNTEVILPDSKSLQFTIDEQSCEAIVTGYDNTDESVTVPSTYKGYKVTKLGESAFEKQEKSKLTNVLLPGTINAIWDCAFKNCTELTSITIPYSTTWLGNEVFSGCTGLTEVTIPNSVTHIRDNAFVGCAELTSVTIGNGVTSIGNSTFSGCTELRSVYYTGDIASWCGIEFSHSYSPLNLDCNPLYYAHNLYINYELVTEIIIPNTITKINEYAFCGWNGTNLTMSDSVTSIGRSAFDDCLIETATIPAIACKYIKNSALKTVVITSGKSIEYSAFNGCTQLTSITIPDSVTSIGEYAFSDCHHLVEVYNKSSLNITKGSENYGGVGYYAKAIYTEPYVSKLSTDENGYILYTDEDEISLVGYTGTNTILTLPEGITEINQYAFYENQTLTNITIPNSVKFIGENAFNKCTGLTSISIGNGVKRIANGAFADCYYLIEVYNKSSLNITKGSEENGSVGYYAKAIYTRPYVSKLSADENGYILYTGEDEISLIVYTGTDTVLTLPEGITEINQGAFSGDKSITSITIPDSVTSIGSGAFYGCDNLTSVYYAGDIASWCGITFDGYSSNPLRYAHNLYINNELQTEIVIPNTVTEIKAYSFIGWNGTSITILDGVTSTGYAAFYKCTELASITIPDSIINIASSFEDCNGLTRVYYMGDISSWCGITFNDNPLYYAHNLYINNELQTEIVIPDTVTEIKDLAFNGWNGTSIIIGNSVTSIGSSAFYNCSNLTSITIPDSVTNIGYKAFDNCSCVATYQGIKYVDTWVIGAEKDLSEAIIKDDTKRIANSAFSNCSALMCITIPDNVTSIGDRAFDNCVGLTSITIGNNLKSIGKDAFRDCYKLVEVYNMSSLYITKGSENNGGIGYYAKAIYTKPYVSKLSIDENGYILYTDEEEISLIGYTGTDTVLNLPEGITEIYQYAFWYNKAVTSITIPNTVIKIDYAAFSDCGSLSSVTIGNNVTSIGWGAFRRCTELISIAFTGKKTQWNAISKGTNWDYGSGSYTVHCSDGDVSK